MHLCVIIMFVNALCVDRSKTFHGANTAMQKSGTKYSMTKFMTSVTTVLEVAI